MSEKRNRTSREVLEHLTRDSVDPKDEYLRGYLAGEEKRTAELSALAGELRAAEVMAKISTRSDREAVAALQVELNKVKALVATRDETIRALEFQLRKAQSRKQGDRP